MPDPVFLNVSEVRSEIHRVAGAAGKIGQGSSPWLGTLFHEVFRKLMQPGTQLHWENVLDADSLMDDAVLREHAWDHIIGPKLRANQAALQSSAAEVLHFWEATVHLCKYICQLLTNHQEQKIIRYDPRAQAWCGLEHYSLEEELQWRIEDPAWSAPVVIRGTADAVWRNPASKRWCVVELKLGQGSPEADLTQLCLYHWMVQITSNTAGTLSLFTFQPQSNNQQFEAAQLEPLRPKLLDLIGALANVKPKPQSAHASTTQPTPAHRQLGQNLLQVLAHFGPMATLESDPIVGPTFLRFHIMPAQGVSIRKILPLGRDLGIQLRLKKPALIREEGGILSIDVEREDRQILHFNEFRPQLPALSDGGTSRLLAGIDLNRQPRFIDLASDCPHVLVVGTAGSGKSEWLLSAIASLIASNTPDTLRLLLIDPKRVSFETLSRSSYLLQPTLFTPDEAIQGLRNLTEIMEDRYQLFTQYGAKDLASLRAKRGPDTPPRIVCICDEYGNLVATKKNRETIEGLVNQLGAKARAAGIHLVIATQDPRATILSPTLKANLGGRVCLKTTSATQSQMMLEENGAESLLGHGDLLFKTTGDPIRLQAPLLDDATKQQLFAPALIASGTAGSA